jgi:uncharacterized protein (DUF1697 family)
MEAWIALLRGINVGGNHIVPMKELKAMLEANGFEDVQSYIQSGNLVFRSTVATGSLIGDLIEKKYGFRPSVFLLNREDFKKAVEANPYKSNVGKTIHFFFLEEDPKMVDFALLDSLKSESEHYALKERVFYLYAPDGIGRSKLVEKLGRAFPGVTMTARNLNTIAKLAAMIE